LYAGSSSRRGGLLGLVVKLDESHLLPDPTLRDRAGEGVEPVDDAVRPKRSDKAEFVQDDLVLRRCPGPAVGVVRGVDRAIGDERRR
jgi:hypothetical protein